MLRANDFYAGRDGLFLKLVRRYAGDIRGKSVVELGGGGNSMRLLALAKWLDVEATVVDFSEEGLRVVEKLFAANGCRVRLISADLNTWVPEAPFDVVTHWGVLEHFLDPRPLLATSAAALKPGGSLMFYMPNMEALAARLWKRWSPANWGVHIWHSDELVLRNMHELGLTDIQSFHYGIPFVKMAPWEQASPIQLPFDLLQKIASASARILPIYHRVGHRKISMERGFSARRQP